MWARSAVTVGPSITAGPEACSSTMPRRPSPHSTPTRHRCRCGSDGEHRRVPGFCAGFCPMILFLHTTSASGGRGLRLRLMRERVGQNPSGGYGSRLPRYLRRHTLLQQCPRSAAGESRTLTAASRRLHSAVRLKSGQRLTAHDANDCAILLALHSEPERVTIVEAVPKLGSRVSCRTLCMYLISSSPPHIPLSAGRLPDRPTALSAVAGEAWRIDRP